MADTKITALAPIGAIDPANDVLPIVDVSNNSMAASGTTCRVTTNQLLQANAIASLASATITGDLTVDTNVLKVDTTNNRVGINTASPAQALDVASGNLQVRTGGTIYSDTFSNYGAALQINSAGSLPLRLQIGGSNAYEITSGNIHTWSNVGGVAGTAMTLNSTGLLVGTTTMPSGVTFARLVAKSTSGDWSGVIWNSNATPYGFRVQHDTDSNGTGNEFLYCLGAGNLRASIRSNGGIANYQANDVSLSDSRLKTDIKPLASYWNKIKSLELVTFKYKDQTHSDDNIGLIAQQVESVAPELVDVDGFGETPDDGVPLKTIYTTDLYHAAIKALQEAMTRIEALEAKLA